MINFAHLWQFFSGSGQIVLPGQINLSAGMAKFRQRLQPQLQSRSDFLEKTDHTWIGFLIEISIQKI
jgi:hypothetical protein